MQMRSHSGVVFVGVLPLGALAPAAHARHKPSLADAVRRLEALHGQRIFAGGRAYDRLPPKVGRDISVDASMGHLAR